MKKDYEWLKIKISKIIQTKDVDNTNNGFLIDILNRNDDIFKDRQEEKFQQFYMTTVLKGKLKGLHVHPFKIDTIFVPKGKICLVLYTEKITKEQSQLPLDFSKYEFIIMGEGNYKTVSYPSYYPHGFWGLTNESIIINYRTPAWNPQDTFQFDIKDENLIRYLKYSYYEI